MLAKCQLFIQNYVILNLIKFMKDIILTTWQFTVMKWGVKPSLRLWKIFPVSPPALNTIARAYVLDFTFWAWWAWDEGYLFDSGHCVSPIFMDRAELFPPWAFVGSRLWGPLLLGYWWSKCHSICEDGHSWLLLILACYLIWLPSTQCFLFATMKEFDNKTTKVSFELQHYFNLSTKFIT